MEELIKQVAAKTGISEVQAKTAGESALSGRMTIAQQFTAGPDSERTVVREADGRTISVRSAALSAVAAAD